MKTPTNIAERIAALELSLLQAPTRFDRNHLEQVLDDEMVEFGKSGKIYDKRSIVQALESEGSGPAPADYLEMVDANALLSAETVLFTYRLRVRPRSGSKAVTSLRSSIWRKNGGTLATPLSSRNRD